ncbi:MAG: hypothetical protein KDD24_10345, partial [Flavobacteriales bacterium]|nr:hypothetical protein [Flavobacteriales bacterium]
MRILIVLIVLLSLFACRPEKKEFTVLDENISYKLLAFDDNEKSYQKGNTVRADIKLIALTDTVYNLYEVIPFKPENTPFYNLIKELNEGDSVYFKVKPGYLK